MAGHGTKFGRKKEETIAALALTDGTSKMQREWPASGTRTLLRWLKLPEFDAAYREARHKAFSQSIARLQQGSTAAATTLLKVMIDPATPPSDARQSRREHFTHSAKAIEIEDIEARVATLEQAASTGKARR